MAFDSKEERQAYDRKWYEKHKERIKDKKNQNTKAFREKRKAWLLEKKGRPCMDCEVQYPDFVMDFDHRDPAVKSFEISEKIAAYSIEVLEAEIAKCDLVCSNCHRIRTHNRRKTHT